MFTPKEFHTYWNTSIPPQSAEARSAIQQFIMDTGLRYDALLEFPDGSKPGLFYSDLSKALKAYDKYKFTEADILKYKPDHFIYVETAKKLSLEYPEHNFVTWRNIPLKTKTLQTSLLV